MAEDQLLPVVLILQYYIFTIAATGDYADRFWNLSAAVGVRGQVIKLVDYFGGTIFPIGSDTIEYVTIQNLVMQ